MICLLVCTPRNTCTRVLLRVCNSLLSLKDVKIESRVGAGVARCINVAGSRALYVLFSEILLALGNLRAAPATVHFSFYRN